MTDTQFPMTESVAWGWNSFWANFAFFAGLWIVIIGLECIVELVPYLAFQDNVMAELLTSVVSALVSSVLEMGVIVVTLKFYDGERAEFSDLFSQIHKVFYYLVASIIYGVMVLIGLVFLIVPGVYLGVRFYFYGFFVVEEDCGPIEALARSSEITQGNIMNLFIWGLLIIGLNILGLLALGVGILLTIPISSLAVAMIYRHLKPATSPLGPISEEVVSPAP